MRSVTIHELKTQVCVTLFVIAAALVAACGGSGSKEASPAGTVSPDSAVAAVESFDPANEEAIARLNEVVQAGGDVVPALSPLLEDTEPNRRWAALYLIALLTDTDEEIAVLKPMLDNDDPIFRVMAAGSLAGLGVTESLPVLIEGLSSDADLPFSDPPQPLSAYTRLTLEEYTGQSFTDATDWQAWWDQAAAGIRWQEGRYVTN